MKKLNFNIFLLLSLLIHIGVFVIQSDKVEFKNKSSFSTEMSEIVRTRTTLKLKSNNYEKVSKLKKSSKKAVKKVSRARKKVALEIETSLKKIENKDAGQNSIKAKYLTSIRSIIQSYKKYPRIARRLKQSGNVGVYFEIEWPNRIKNIQLQKPSKHGLLNKSAISTLQSMDAIPRMPQELANQTLRVTIPISYELL